MNNNEFQEDILNVLKKHFNIEYVEDMSADIETSMCREAGFPFAILRHSLKLTCDWSTPLTEKEAKKYGKELR